MAKDKYTESDIEVLSERDHVRLRAEIYLGSIEPATYTVPLFRDNGIELKDFTFSPAAYKAVGEVIDNSLDEFTKTPEPHKVLTITSNSETATYSVEDTGRGVPIGVHESGKPTPEVVFGNMRSGRNFKDDQKEAGVIGMNGVGACVTNFCSAFFDVSIHRDKKHYSQSFVNGAQTVFEPVIKRKPSAPTGTKIEFQLDPTVFKHPVIPSELFENRAKEIAFNRPDVITRHNGTEYHYPKGFEAYLKTISKDYYKFEAVGIEFFVVFDLYQGIDERVFSWVNNTFMFDGGLCNTQFVNAFIDRVIASYESRAKKANIVVSKNDIRRNLLVFGFLKIANPKFDAQAKTRMTGPNMRDAFKELVDAHWSSFAKKQKDWLESTFVYAEKRYQDETDSKAKKEHKKAIGKKPIGLLDADGTNRRNCKLIITEGLSAASSLVEVRDRSIGSYPLGGKINNVYGCRVREVLAMQKVVDLLVSIGLEPGVPADRNTLRFGEVIIATDADYDGADIFCTLVCLFYQFWPELFDPKQPPFISRLVAPNICLVKGTKRVHFSTPAEYEKNKHKYPNYEVNYYKGLGSLEKEDWRMMMGALDEHTYGIVDDGKIGEVLRLWFSDDALARRKKLSDE